ncbi:MAG TPA: HlyD family efflux transporter periplasmic adaptor subunit [Pseudonocardia sp.]
MTKRWTKIAYLVIGLVTLVEAVAFSGTYLIHTRHYVSTDNAMVDGDAIEIRAPLTGTLLSWSITAGSTVSANEVVGRIQQIGGGAQPQRVIKAAKAGTIAVDNATPGQYVTAGTRLATAYDDVYVTARVAEDDIGGVHEGNLVDITVDASPDRPLLGRVTDIQVATASEFTIYPAAGIDPRNPQKIDQYLPVRIALINTNGVELWPGMNVDVTIRRS